MAINFNVGLEEIKQSGNVMSQGFQQLGQQQTQASQGWLNIEGQRQQRVAQNAAQKRQDNQQIWDSVLQAGETFAKISLQTQQAEKQKVLDKQNEQKFDWEKEDRAKRNIIQKGAEEAYIQEGNKDGDYQRPYESLSEYAARRQGIKQIKVEALGLEQAQANLSKTKGDISNASTRLQLDKDQVDIEKKKNDLIAAQNIAIREQTSALKSGQALNTANKAYEETKKDVIEAADPDSYRRKLPVDVQEKHKKAVEQINFNAGTITNNRTIQDRLMEVTGKKRGTDNKYSLADIDSAVTQLTSPDIGSKDAETVKLIAGEFIANGIINYRKIAPGVMTEQDQKLADKISGADALTRLSLFEQLTESNPSFMAKLTEVTQKQLKQKGAIEALFGEMERKDGIAKRNIELELQKSDGAYAVNPMERASSLYNLLPLSEQQKTSLTQFAKLPEQDQVLKTLGENSAKNIDFTSVNTHDANANNIGQRLDDIEKRARKTSFGIEGMTPTDTERINNMYQTDVATYINNTRNPTKNAPGVLPNSVNNDSTPVKGSGGKTIPIVAADNTAFFNPNLFELNIKLGSSNNQQSRTSDNPFNINLPNTTAFGE
jgi:hypothetical protein